MHPYRDKEDLADIRENIAAIKDMLASTDETLTNLKLPKQNPISQAIRHKIEKFSLVNFLLTICVFAVVVSSFGCLGFIIYKNLSTPADAISTCQFDYNLNPDDGIFIMAVIEWHGDKYWGPFKNMEEAKEFAKMNNCPE